MGPRCRMGPASIGRSQGRGSRPHTGRTVAAWTAKTWCTAAAEAIHSAGSGGRAKTVTEAGEHWLTWIQMTQRLHAAGMEARSRVRSACSGACMTGGVMHVLLGLIMQATVLE